MKGNNTRLNIGLGRQAYRSDEHRSVKDSLTGKSRAQHPPGTPSKAGQFRKKTTPKSILDQTVTKETTPKANIEYSTTYGPIGLSANAEASPMGFSANFQAKHTLLEHDLGDLKLTVISGAVSGSANLKLNGITAGFNVQGPSVEASIPKSFCIGPDQLTFTAELSAGLGIGAGMHMKKGLTAKGKPLTVFGGTLGTGLQGGANIGIEFSPNDPNCQAPGPSQPWTYEQQIGDTRTYNLETLFSRHSTSLPFSSSRTYNEADDIRPSTLETTPAQPDSQESTIPGRNENQTQSSWTPLFERTPEEQREVISNLLLGAGLSPADITLSMEALLNVEADENADERTALIYRHTQAGLGWLNKIPESAPKKETSTTEEIIAGLDILGLIAKSTSSKPLNQCVVVAKSIMVCYKAINELGSLFKSKTLKVSDLLNPFSMFGGVAETLFACFLGEGPDPTTLILQQIEALSKQIDKLSERIDEQFSISIDHQIRTMKSINTGFHQLKHLLHQEISAQRAETRHQLLDIQNLVHFYGEYQIHGQYETFIRPLTELINTANDWLNGNNLVAPENKIPKLNNTLFHWINTHSSNQLLNGLIFFKSWLDSNKDDTLIQQFISLSRTNQEDQSFRLNSYIGFGAAYVLNARRNYIHRFDIKDAPELNLIPDDLVNPIIWTHALESALKLRVAFPSVIMDYDAIQIDAALEKGNTIQDTIDLLTNDEYVWSALLDDYYTALKNIKEIVDKLSEFNSNEILAACNLRYSENEQEKVQKGFASQAQEPVTDFDILNQQPAELIAQFAQRTANCIELSTVNSHANYIHAPERIIQTFDAFKTNTLSKKPLFDALASRENIVPDVFAAQFLGLVRLEAKQASPIRGLTWKGYYPVEARYDHGYHGRENSGCSARWVYPSLGKMTATIPLQYVMTSENWSLPMTIKAPIIYGLPSPYELGNLTWTGDWRYLAPVVHDLNPCSDAHRNDPNTTELDGKHVAMYGLPGHFDDFFQHSVNEIKRAWNANTSPALTLASRQTPLGESNPAIIELLNNYYFDQRKLLARSLLSGNASNGGQEHIKLFKKTLAHLDKSVTLLLWFTNITGKSIKDTAFENLITSKTVNAALESYLANNTCDLNRPLIDVLTTALASEPLNFNDINNIKTLETADLPVFHPRSIIAKGLNRLSMYKVWIQLLAEKFPGFNDASLLEYEIKCEILSKKISEDETNQHLRELKAEGFSKARFFFQTELDHFSEMSARGYQKAYREVCRWTNEISKYPSEIGRSGFLGNDLSKVDEQMWIKKMLPRGWESNILYLMTLAEHYGNCKFRGLSPVNVDMWSEGLLTFLQVIFDEKLNPIAELAGNKSTHRSNSLNQILICGKETKRIIYTMGLSHSLFDNLFQLYETHLTIFSEWLLKNVKTSISAYTSIAIGKNQFHVEKMNTLCTYGAVLYAYIRMIFGDHINAEIQKRLEGIYISHKVLVDDMKEKEGRSYTQLPVFKRLEQQKQSIIVLKNFVTNEINKAIQIYQFWQFLRNYFIGRWPTTTLEISAELLKQKDKKDFDKAELDMIASFLQQNRFINQLVISDISMSAETFSDLLSIIEKTPHVCILAVRNAGLETTTLINAISPETSLPQLKILDLSKNNLKTAESLLEHFSIPNLSIFNYSDLPVMVNQSHSEVLKRQKPPTQNISLSLPLGPNRLNELLRLGSKAKTALEKRIFIENRGIDLNAKVEVQVDLEEEKALQSLMENQSFVKKALAQQSTSSFFGASPKPSTSRQERDIKGNTYLKRR